MAGLPSTPLPASWVGGCPPAVPQEGRAFPEQGQVSPSCPSMVPTDVRQMWLFPGRTVSVIRGAVGLRRPCAHSVGQFPHVLGRRGHSKVPSSADTIRGVSGPTATPLVSTAMLGAVCLVLLLGYGGCRAWGRVGAGGTGPWGLPGPWAWAQAASDVPLPRVTQPMDAASRPCHHS